MFYRSRLERDLIRWRDAGYISDASLARIREEQEQTKSAFGAAQGFAMLGAVLFGFAIMSFVAANWDGMSKLARLLLLLVTLWASYGGAAVLSARKHDLFAQAAIVGGIAVYGASIMLIAQMYHMDGHPPDAVLLWALGALITSYLTRSGAALASAFALGITWTIYERVLGDVAHWSFLPFWAVSLVTAIDLKWRPGLHLAAVSFLAWLVPLGFFIQNGHGHWLPLAVGLVAALAASAGSQSMSRLGPIAPAIFVYAVATALAELYIMQFIDERMTAVWFDGRNLTVLIILAIMTLTLLLATMAWGSRQDNTVAIWLAYAGFAFEIFALYVKTFGNLLNTSLFFLVAALLVTGLAWLAYRLHHRNTPTASAAT